MPLGPFKNFADCTSHMVGKGESSDSADKICGHIKAMVEGKKIEDAASFPFDECLSKMSSEGYSSDSANKICGSIRAKYGSASIADASAKVIKYSENGKLFIRAFLIDATENVNQWAVTKDSIPEHIKTFVGKPLVLTEDYSHPALVSASKLEPNLQYQERFAIGRITRVVQKGTEYDAIIEITDPLARDAIENNDIPFFVSPRIFRTNLAEPKDETKSWTGVHLAVVDNPAYGHKATIDAVCEGSDAQCTPALLSASDESCGFCFKAALLKLVNNGDSSHSSHVHDAKNLQNVMGDNPENSKVDLSGYVPKAEYEAKIAEITALKVAFEEAKKASDARLAAIEEENRTAKITAILSAKIEDKKTLEEKVKYFVEAKTSPEVVANAFSLVPDIAAKPAKGKDNSGKFEQASNEKPSNFEQMIAYESRRFA